MVCVGNRAERKFENPDVLDFERKNARNHISFGFGIHRCFGNRLAKLQLQILWDEMLKRFSRVEVIGEPSQYLKFREGIHQDECYRPRLNVYRAVQAEVTRRRQYSAR